MLDRIIEIIAVENPDIVALQEVDKNLDRSAFNDQTRIIGTELAMNHHHCVNRFIADGEYGITTLTRFPIVNKQRHDLSYNKRNVEPRGSLRTDLLVEDPKFKYLHFFNVHLGLGVRERQHQRRRLLSESILLDDTMQDPVVVAGDFNDRPISVVHSELRQHFLDAVDLIGQSKKATFRWGPVKFRLDHIYLSKQLHAIEAHVIKTSLTRVASDHLPLVATVETR